MILKWTLSNFFVRIHYSFTYDKLMIMLLKSGQRDGRIIIVVNHNSENYKTCTPNSVSSTSQGPSERHSETH